MSLRLLNWCLSVGVALCLLIGINIEVLLRSSKQNHSKIELVTQLELEKAANDATGFIVNCSYFRKNFYPNYVSFARMITRQGVQFAFNPFSSKLCAWTDYSKFPAIVMLTTTSILRDKNCGDLVDTFMHEFLHVAGLPLHTKPLDQLNDPVYKTVAACRKEFRK